MTAKYLRIVAAAGVLAKMRGRYQGGKSRGSLNTPEESNGLEDMPSVWWQREIFYQRGGSLPRLRRHRPDRAARPAPKERREEEIADAQTDTAVPGVNGRTDSGPCRFGQVPARAGSTKAVTGERRPKAIRTT